MIRIENLDFAYPQGAFRLSIDQLVIESGSHVAVIGPSGSGKTTLLHLMAGIEVPDAGRVETASANVSSLSDAGRRDFRARNIGLVFQAFELVSYLSVLDNILLPYRINRSLVLSEETRSRAAELAENVGIADKLDRSVDHLSQGERQRAAICRALLARPAVILADEPTGNLDPENKSRVLGILLDSARTANATLVTVTHEHDVLERFDRTIDFATLRQAQPAGGAQ